MKKLKVTLIMILAFIALGLIGIVAYFATTGVGLSGFHIGGNTTLAKESSISMQDITSLEIDYRKNYFDIFVYESDSDELILKEYMSEELDQGDLAKININNNGNLHIKGPRINSSIYWFSFNSERGFAEIYIPKDYSGSLSIMTTSGEIVIDKNWISNKELSLASSSGDIRVKDITAEKIAIATSSGNINADSLNGARSIAASSGDIKILGGNGDSAIATNSGNISVYDLNGEFNIATSSGDIKSIDGKGFGRATSSSGNVTVELDEVLGNVSLTTSSGDVILRIPEKLNFQFEANTSSGDINTFFDNNLTYNKNGDYASGMIGDTSELSIVINTSSGNATVSRK